MTNKTLIKLLRQAGPEGVANNPEIALEVMRKAAAALEAQEWQPIETAPQDGTPILGWDGGNHEVRTAEWYSCPQFSCFTCLGGDVPQFTHWKPLPLPPEAE